MVAARPVPPRATEPTHPTIVKPNRASFVIAVAALLCLRVPAAEVIEGVTATASSEWGPDRAVANLVNNSGILAAGSTPGNQTPAG